MKITEQDIDGLATEELYQVAGWIAERVKERSEGSAAKTVLECLRSDPDTADLADRGVRVRFRANHWDDGYWYDEHDGMVVLADGTEEEVDFHETPVHELLSDLSHVQRNADGIDQYSRLWVDLVTGKVEHDRRG